MVEKKIPKISNLSIHLRNLEEKKKKKFKISPKEVEENK